MSSKNQSSKNCLQELYKNIGNGMFHTIPEEWSSAKIDVTYFNNQLLCIGSFVSRFNSQAHEFDVHERTHQDFEKLREITLNDGEDWNIAEFSLERSGQFKLNFSLKNNLQQNTASK